MDIPSLEQLAQIGEVITSLGVVFVVVQVWLLWRNSRVELITGMTNLFAEIDRVLVENPDLQKYFGLLGDSEAEPDRSSEEWCRAHAVALMMANTLDHVVEHLAFLAADTRHAWKQYITELYEKSPVFRSLLEEHPDWWPGLQAQLR